MQVHPQTVAPQLAPSRSLNDTPGAPTFPKSFGSWPLALAFPGGSALRPAGALTAPPSRGRRGHALPGRSKRGHRGILLPQGVTRGSAEIVFLELQRQKDLNLSRVSTDTVTSGMLLISLSLKNGSQKWGDVPPLLGVPQKSREALSAAPGAASGAQWVHEKWEP